jgi:hypothetical protein
MFADGSNGSVEFAGDSIIIRRKGLANKLTQGFQGDKHIPLTSITAVQFRSAGSMMAGMIQFSILGGREFRGGMLEATKDENAVMFTRDQEPVFAAIRHSVQQGINEGGRPATVSKSSAAEELERLAALREKGHLTSEEFSDAKRRVLSAQSATYATPSPRTPVPYTPAPTGHPSRPSPAEGASAFEPARSKTTTAIIWIGGCVLLIILIGQCSQS